MRMWFHLPTPMRTHCLSGVLPVHTGHGSLKKGSLPVVSSWGTGQRSWGIFSTGTVDGNLLKEELGVFNGVFGELNSIRKAHKQSPGWTKSYTSSSLGWGTETPPTQFHFPMADHRPGYCRWRSQIHPFSENILWCVSFRPPGSKYPPLNPLNSSFYKLQELDREMPSWYMSIFHKHPLLAIRQGLCSPRQQKIAVTETF